MGCHLKDEVGKMRKQIHVPLGHIERTLHSDLTRVSSPFHSRHRDRPDKVSVVFVDKYLQPAICRGHQKTSLVWIAVHEIKKQRYHR